MVSWTIPAIFNHINRSEIRLMVADQMNDHKDTRGYSNRTTSLIWQPSWMEVELRNRSQSQPKSGIECD